MKDYRNLQETNSLMSKELKKLENKLVGLELNNRNLKSKIQKIIQILNKVGYTKDKIDKIVEDSESDDSLQKNEERVSPG